MAFNRFFGCKVWTLSNEKKELDRKYGNSIENMAKDFIQLNYFVFPINLFQKQKNKKFKTRNWHPAPSTRTPSAAPRLAAETDARANARPVLGRLHFPFYFLVSNLLQSSRIARIWSFRAAPDVSIPSLRFRAFPSPFVPPSAVARRRNSPANDTQYCAALRGDTCPPRARGELLFFSHSHVAPFRTLQNENFSQMKMSSEQTKEVAMAYMSTLTDLRSISKVEINNLTILANENVECAPMIVDVVSSQLMEVKTGLGVLIFARVTS